MITAEDIEDMKDGMHCLKDAALQKPRDVRLSVESDGIKVYIMTIDRFEGRIVPWVVLEQSRINPIVAAWEELLSA